MCRLLTVISSRPIDVRHHLDSFASMCKNSSEYQGHGWGYAVLHEGGWDRYRTVTPVWEDTVRPVREAHVLLAHARSAFRDEGIEVENNMPFIDGDQVFIFNGELHGVRLPVRGRTGAERLFHFLRHPARSGSEEALERALALLRSRTAHVRASNFIIADPRRVILHSEFAGESSYFTMHRRLVDNELTICSAPYENGDPRWTPIPQNTFEVYPCSC